MDALRCSRRDLLGLLGVGFAGALAGCERGDETAGTPSPEQTTGQTPTPTQTTPQPTPDPPSGGALSDPGFVPGDAFGSAVAIDDAVFVGAPSAGSDGSGLVDVFEWSGADWDTVSTLGPAESEAGDRFGSALAVDGDTLLVGAYGWASGRDDPDTDAAGAAYVFERADGEWVEQTRLVPADGDAYDRFGYSLAVEDGTALIGAYNDEDPNGDSAGAAYVFERTGDGWSQQSKLFPEDGDEQDYFGRSVDLDGDRALIGARRATTLLGGEKAGAAYVFERTGASWSQQAKLTPRDGDSWDRFGEAVALDGTTALVGAYGDEDPVGDGRFDGAGSAYVFERREGQWRQQAKLTAEASEPTDAFGVEVALDGGTALVGAPTHDIEGVEDAGTAVVFRQDGTEWTESDSYTAAMPTENGRFGTAVELGTEIVAVGAPGAADDPETAGSATVVER